MKQLYREDGYSLLFTLMILILFTVLGMSILTLTMSGSKRTETREDILQSTDLASKGVKHITNEITYDLNQFLKGNSKTAGQFESEFNRVISQYKCVGGSPIQSDDRNGTNPEYRVCIEGNPKIDKETLRADLTFKSTGYQDGKERVLRSTFNIGATKYPEVLNYAVGSYKVSKDADAKRFPKIPGEGNLVINGGANIVGDLKVDGNLITSNNGVWRRNDCGISVGSVLPALSASASSSPKLFLGGNMYRFNYEFPGLLYNRCSNSISYESHVSGEKLDNKTYYTKMDSPKSLFVGEEPRRIGQSIEIKPLQFEEKKAPLVVTPTSSTKYYPRDAIVNNENRSSPTYVAGYVKRECVLIFFCNDKTYEGTASTQYTLSGTNQFKKMSTNGSILLNGSTTAIQEGAFVNGNFTIKGNSTISGTIYVGGDLTIENARLNSDVIFYVDGNVTITESEVYGVPYKDRTGSLIMFAKGDIKLSNNSVDKDQPSTIKGYFYSEQVMEIYGVGSNIKIDGGISGRRIILNAVRGSSNNYTYQSRAVQERLPKEKSRLQVIYDKDIIKNFSELDVQTEPIIESVAPPQELDRNVSGE